MLTQLELRGGLLETRIACASGHLEELSVALPPPPLLGRGRVPNIGESIAGKQSQQVLTHPVKGNVRVRIQGRGPHEALECHEHRDELSQKLNWRAGPFAEAEEIRDGATVDVNVLDGSKRLHVPKIPVAAHALAGVD